MSNDAVNFLNSAMRRGIDSRFEPKKLVKGETPLPFDYVRASVNLVVSAALIASATSLKLPLSTTYVTFMVAMGSSFADGAWDSETAVYRISVVLTVISGWFLTTLAASTMAALVCWLTLWGEELVSVILGAGSVFLPVRSNLRTKVDAVNLRAALDTRYDAGKMKELVAQRAEINFEKTVELFGRLVNRFLEEHEGELCQVKVESSALFDKMSADRSLYYRISTNLREVGRSLQSLTKLATEHVANRHRLYQGELKDDLIGLAQYLKDISTGEDGMLDIRNVAVHAQEAADRIDALQAELLRRIPSERLSVRGSELYLNFLVFAREFVNRWSMVTVLQGQLDLIVKPASQA